MNHFKQIFLYMIMHAHAFNTAFYVVWDLYFNFIQKVFLTRWFNGQTGTFCLFVCFCFGGVSEKSSSTGIEAVVIRIILFWHGLTYKWTDTLTDKLVSLNKLIYRLREKKSRKTNTQTIQTSLISSKNLFIPNAKLSFEDEQFNNIDKHISPAQPTTSTLPCYCWYPEFSSSLRGAVLRCLGFHSLPASALPNTCSWQDHLCCAMRCGISSSFATVEVPQLLENCKKVCLFHLDHEIFPSLSIT